MIDPLEGANCHLCGATADNFHVTDELWERVGLGDVQACFKCFRIAAWHAGVHNDGDPWEVSLGNDFEALRVWVKAHLDALPAEDEWDDDAHSVISSLECIVSGNLGCTEEADYTPEQWRVLMRCQEATV